MEEIDILQEQDFGYLIQKPIVIDIGSYSTKFGIAGDFKPKIVPTIFAKNSFSGNSFGESAFECVGEFGQVFPVFKKEKENEIEKNEKFQNSKIENQIPNFPSTNQNEIENQIQGLLSYIFDKLNAYGDERGIIITNSLTKRIKNENLAHILFDYFGSSLIYIINEEVASLFSIGKKTGIVLNSGENFSDSIPIYDGNLIRNVCFNSNFGGKDVNNFLLDVIKNNNEFLKFESYKEMKILIEIKEKLLKIKEKNDKNEKNEKEKEKNEKNEKVIEEIVEFTLPDNKILKLKEEEIYKPTEFLFDPKLINSNDFSIDNLIFNSLNSFNEELKRQFYVNIFLSGGNTMFKGFENRLKFELEKKENLNGIKIDFINNFFEKDISSWIGASNFSLLSNFNSFCVSINQYTNLGPQIINKKFFY